MEPHKNLGNISQYAPDISDGPKAYFEKAYVFTKKFYENEFNYISSTKHESVDAEFFFREYIFVVHATGFSAKAVGNFMPRLVEAYGPYQELAERSLADATGRVKVVCNNPQKIKAVHSTALQLRDGIKLHGWNKFKKDKLSTPEKLQALSYIGPVTCFHLARNIGLLDCVKPDLHLIRLANHWGFADCTSMCKKMGEGSGLPLGIVDLVIWYAASHFGTIEIRKDGDR